MDPFETLPGMPIVWALPGTLRIAEVNLYIGSHCEAFVLGHLQSAVPSQRAPQRRGEFSYVLAQGSHHGSGVLARHLHQHAETRMTLHQRGHVTVARPAQQVAFPMTGDGTIFDFRGSFSNGDGIDDLALGVPMNTCVPRAADPPLGAKVLNQLLFYTSNQTSP